MVVLYYLLKLSLGLAITWLFYQLVLRRLTFYNWNRWFLVVCPALAFLLPLIDIAPVLEKNNWNKTTIVSAIPQIPAYNPMAVEIVPVKTITEQIIGWCPLLIVLGALVMLVRLLIQYFSLLAMRRHSTLLLNGPVKVYQVNKPVIPFSFGNAIFLNQHLHGEEELKEIIRHEFIHVKQRHTFDIVWSELICILTWYNPFSWLLRKATRQNLEFIADRQVLKAGLDRREYQYLLLKVIGVPSFSIASNFNFKSLKKRIAMMNKVKTARVHLVRFALLLPVVAILLVAFRNAAQHRQQQPPAKVTADTIAPGKKGFPENVRSFYYNGDNMTVILKDGKEEKYDLANEKEKAAFEEKYGKMPEPPAPPHAPAAPIHDIAAPVPPHHAPAAPAAPIQDDCYNDKGYCLSVINTPKGQMVLVVRKEKKEVELVTLEDWKKDKKYETKFGKLPVTPPLPPAAPGVPAHMEYDMPEEVSRVHVRDYDAVVTNKNGTIDRYDLRLAKDKKDYDLRFRTQVIRDVPVHAVMPDGKHARILKDVAVASPVVAHDIVDVTTTRINDVPRAMPVAEKLLLDVEATGNEEILAVITKNTSFNDLDKIKSELKAKGITLTWLNRKADDGKLVMLEGKMTAGSNKCHFQVDDFTRLTLTRKKAHDGQRPFGVHSVSEKVND